MKTWKSLAFAVVVLAMSAVTTMLLVTTPPETRSAGPVNKLVDAPARPVFSRAASTGLFVGVRTFQRRDLVEVPYAADDAVDLAYRFALDQRSSLVPPGRIILALSGNPVKKESQERLRALTDAGALKVDATADRIMELARQQAARAGTDGLFVLSLASHGFLGDDGNAYVLGSTSELGSPKGALPMEKLFDVAGHATRSLVFVDACRDRVTKNARGGPDPTTAAPLLRKMDLVEGQVIFLAAAADHYAYDDPASRNGVFTKAVLDGLACGASAPRGEVIASTLYTYVQRAVRRWLVENDKKPVDPVTQMHMEGDTRNMPLAQCWRSAKFPIRASVDGSTVTTYDLNTRPLWRKELPGPIVSAEAADLDEDAFYEVVVGTATLIRAFDRDGNPLWEKSENGMRLVTFAVGDLFRKHTKQTVALWTDGRASLLTVFDSKGNKLASHQHAGLLERLLLGRPNNHNNLKIITADMGRVLLFEPRKLARRWEQKLASRIEEVRVVGPNIEVKTKAGWRRFTFDGRRTGPSH